MFNCAPSLKRWSINEKWYEEDYVEGSLDSSYRPMEAKVLLNKFYSVIVPCLEELIAQQGSKISKLRDYLNDIRNRFENITLSVQTIDAGTADEIAQFYHSICDKLDGRKDYVLFLIFSHGDFCPANIVNTNHAIKIIDWESSSYRNVLFDFYSYFFYRPVCRSIDIGQMNEEMNEDYIFLVSRLCSSVPAIHRSIIASEDVYRWLYFTKRLYMLIERLRTDTYSPIILDIHNRIESFKCYEELILLERTVQESRHSD